MADTPLEKRRYCFVLRPIMFDIAGCPNCGNYDTEWSEYAKHCWCAKCQIDFIPADKGIFDGPIPTQLCQMMGITFDRYDLQEKKVIKFDTPEWHKAWP